MSKNAQILLGAVVIIAIVVAVFALAGTMQKSTTLPQNTDTSNDALGQDTAAIDAELSGLESDRAVIDQSFEDVP